MFRKIMTPVDLAHAGDIETSLKCSADLARHYDAEIVYVGVAGSQPSAVAHNEKEYGDKLARFAESQAAEHGIRTSSKAKHCNDLAAEVDDALVEAVDDTGADLVVMQSHLPKLTDYVWPSNGGNVARHAKVSVMIVRDN